jgi:hypothetical protein
MLIHLQLLSTLCKAFILCRSVTALLCEPTDYFGNLGGYRIKHRIGQVRNHSGSETLLTRTVGIQLYQLLPHYLYYSESKEDDNDLRRALYVEKTKLS